MPIQIAPIVAVDSMTLQTGQPMRLKGTPGGRPILRADTMIVAAAKIYGAVNIYSHDTDVRALANTISKDFGLDLPDPPIDLWGNPSDKDE